jgi:hypothetical protein
MSWRTLARIPVALVKADFIVDNVVSKIQSIRKPRARSCSQIVWMVDGRVWGPLGANGALSALIYWRVQQ